MDRDTVLPGVQYLSQAQTRRSFLKRSAITVAVPAFASLLAACGGDDNPRADAGADAEKTVVAPYLLEIVERTLVRR